MRKWITLQNSVLLTDAIFAFCFAVFIVSAVSHIVNKQNGLLQEIKELRADVKKSIWLEAVERGYAEEVETSEGKVFIWKENNDDVDTWTIGMKNES